MAKAGVRNPLFLLDEIDKMGMDHRGDPASAMLEVLDPEQNHAFNDHYLEVDYDLSDVMFVCTSNTMNIPGPLLDRMEVIRIPGYTEDEKLNIAQRYLIPKQVKLNGLKKDEIELAEETLIDIIRYYTREAGVRALEREIAKVCRKMVKAYALGECEGGATVTAEMLADLLGVRKFNYGIAEEENKIGQVTGLAWTSVGGELLTIEAVAVAGKGRHGRPAPSVMSCRSRYRPPLPWSEVAPRCWVFPLITTRNTMCMSTCRREQPPKMVPVQVSPCVLPWYRCSRAFQCALTWR
jgi:ATP-dependent Lon protease